MYHVYYVEIIWTCSFDWFWFGFMAFNVTFNNISAISWLSVLLVEETNKRH